MAKNELNDEDKLALLKAVNNGVEPPPDLLPKLYPSTMEKLDRVALDRSKIPTLEYAGKRSKAAILAEATAGIGAAPLQVVREFGDAKGDEWRNMIVQGDNLQFLKTCFKNEDPLIKDKVKGKVKLIYIDPPFATEGDFGGSEGQNSYSDKIARSEFIESLRERLFLMRDLLSADGVIYVHLDHRMSHYVKVAMDEIFTKEAFLNHIIWSFNTRTMSTPYFARKHNDILFYRSRGKQYFDIDAVRVPHNPDSLAQYNKVDESGKRYKQQSGSARSYLNEIGQPCPDVWEIQILGSRDPERAGYETQKPEALLERIIKASTAKGDLVLDAFAGSGTTAAVAEKLGRRWISCDFGKHAIYTMQKRMLRIGESRDLLAPKKEVKKHVECDECGNKKVLCGTEQKNSDARYEKDPKPFSVVSAGAYDFKSVMKLGDPGHKDAYIAFVLGLFQLARDDDSVKKLKLTNVHAQKDSAPVEIYPVWDEKYLKEVKIDHDYLEGIAKQARSLKGVYYIITPETCTNIFGDKTLKNDKGEKITFKMLTFPYKILEDVSRHLELHNQPASQGAVNELITSTAFYFNEDVEIEVNKSKDGLRLTKFKTEILNKDGNRFEGLDGLAMLLIDFEHKKEKPFDMDATVFASDIKEDGSFAIVDSKGKIAVIAIDKHGNESKPYVVS